MTHRLDIVTVRTDDEGGIVVGVVLRPHTRGPIVLASSGEGIPIELVNLAPGLCSEREVEWRGVAAGGAQPERRLVVSPQAYGVRHFHRENDAKRRKRFQKKCFARAESLAPIPMWSNTAFLLDVDSWKRPDAWHQLRLTAVETRC